MLRSRGLTSHLYVRVEEATRVEERARRTSLVSSHRAVEPRVPQYATWSIILVMPTQPALVERRHKHKLVIQVDLYLGFTNSMCENAQLISSLGLINKPLHGSVRIS